MMGKELYFILMADIIGSRRTDQQRLIMDFKEIVSQTNISARNQLLSPITVTLGDEFQSVVKSLSSAVAIILQLEESIIVAGKNFKLRYSLVEGEIETAINTKIAYEMLGSGLTEARENLTALKKMKTRFHVAIQDQVRGNAINNAFVVIQRIVDDWKLEKDYYIVAKFLQHMDYKQVASELNKERSLMWKREKSLRLEEYFALKDVITYLGGNNDV
jgi:hypothetical protein